MEPIDPTQVITIGGLAALMFTGLIGFFIWYIKRVEKERDEVSKERSGDTTKIAKLVEQSNTIIQKNTESNRQQAESNLLLTKSVDGNTKSIEASTRSNEENRAMTRDMMALLAEVMRGRDKT